MSDWILHYDSFEPEKEGIRESLCTLGNGYIAIRGASEESTADEMHYPGTYLAGGYNRLKTKIQDEIIENEDLVNFPNCLLLSFKIKNSDWFNLKNVETLHYEKELNLFTGLLSRKIHFRDREGRETHFSIRRFVSMNDPHVVAIEMSLRAVNWEGEIEIFSGLDGRIENAGVERYMQLSRKHLEHIEIQSDENLIFLKTATSQSQIFMAQAARTCVNINGRKPSKIVRGIFKEDKYVQENLKFHVQKEQTILVEKLICIYTSKDRAISECGLEARNAVMRLRSFEELYNPHQIAWKYLWQRFDIEIKYEASRENILLLLRLHIFHLLQTTSLHSIDLDIGVPPRGWHGEAYRGHILWDELFIFSMLNLQLPELTKSLLLYRYRRLPQAKIAVEQLNLKGAMYPWQSGSNGREESQKIHLNPLSGRWIQDSSHLERHVNSTIAYNVWRYFESTNDLEFLAFYGAEMLLEIARFWANLCSYNPTSNRYEIRKVMGPDEYHDGYPEEENPGVNNNAYTNVMAAWVLGCALQVVDIIPKNRRRELEERMGLSHEEMRLWDKIRKKIYIPFHEGIISQFEGYEHLKELDWEKYRKKYDNIHRMDRILEAEGDHVNRYKISKQADVLMLFYLFSMEELRSLFDMMGYKLENEMIGKTIMYYLKRSSHGSTLSKMVHSWVLSRFDRGASWKLFCDAVVSDFEDVQGGTTAEGIHLGAMAGTVDLVQRCYTGIELRENHLIFNPRLPKELSEMAMTIHYRNHTLNVLITHKKLIIQSENGTIPLQLTYHEKNCSIKGGERVEFALKNPALPVAESVIKMHS